ncbi:hypothetical protein GCM10009765_17900 [Fodinicola feengrottensis]|uniref:Type IV secretion system protein n=1 Tax=Fodinicola feengrottensis TaxID=435914 RepID=A0ABN2GC73_9ACTN
MHRNRRSLARLGRRATGLLMIAMVMVGIGISGAQPAAALPGINPANTTCNRTPFVPERADQGVMSLISLSGVSAGTPLVSQAAQAAAAAGSPTAAGAAGDLKGSIWGQYGAAGTYWTTYQLDCTDFVGQIFNNVSNQVFQFAKIISVVTINVFQVTFTGDILRYFLASNGGAPSLLDQVIAQTHATIYSSLFAVAVLIAAIVMLWRFLFGKLPASTFWGKFIQMVLVAGLATFISVGANFSGMLNWVNDQTVTISSTMISAFSSPDCVSDPRNWAGTTTATDSTRVSAVGCAADALYRATVFSPWVIGELGTYDETVGGRILHQQAYSYPDINNNKKDPTLYTSGGGSGTNLSSFKDKKDDRDSMLTSVFGVNSLERLNVISYSDITANKDAGYWQYYSGGQAGGRFLIALLALFASIMVGIIILAISVSYLLLEISSIMFAMLALPAALFGLIPGFGMRVFLRWAELLLGSFAKRIVLGLFAGLVIGLYQALLNANGVPWTIKILFITLVAAFGLLYRKRFAEAFTFNFSGSRSFYEHGEGSQRLLSGYLSKVENIAQKGDQVEAIAKTAATAGMGGVGAAAGAAGAGAGGGGGSQTGDRIRSIGNFLPGVLRAGADDTKTTHGEIPVPSQPVPQRPQPAPADSGAASSIDRLAAKADRAAGALDSAAASSRGVSAGSQRTSNVVYVPPPHQPATPPPAGAPAPERVPSQGVPMRDRR